MDMCYGNSLSNKLQYVNLCAVHHAVLSISIVLQFTIILQFSQPHHVSQFQITDWTADCRCGDINTLITVIDQMAKVQRRTGNNPIVVHGV